MSPQEGGSGQLGHRGELNSVSLCAPHSNVGDAPTVGCAARMNSGTSGDIKVPESGS